MNTLSIQPTSKNRSVKANELPKDATVKIARHIQLINEALSRARMRQPQTNHSEAHRSARRISMDSHRESNRMLGL
jgi:plasmid maintenance system killer protein